MVSNFEKIIVLVILFLVVVIGGNVRYGAADTNTRTFVASITGISSFDSGGTHLLKENSSEVSLALSEAAVEEEKAVQRPDFYRVEDGAPPALAFAAGLIANVEKNETYFEQNSAKRWPIASVTKLMTAAVALDLLDPAHLITIESTDFRNDQSATQVVAVGERYRAGDLISAMLLASSNPAAEALARAYGRVEFIAAMNEKAHLWGMEDTYISDPSGLSVSNQSTARDLKKMTANIYAAYPQVFSMTETSQAEITELVSRAERTVKNINLFAGRPGFLGGKTGYIEDSKGNLVSLFLEAGKPVAVIVLGSDDRFGETETLFSWFKHAFRSSG